MFTKAEKYFSGVLLIICAGLAIIGYAATGTSSPPKRVWFDAAGGDVVFDHTYHAAFAACEDCHHDYEEGVEDQEMSCRACHYYGEAAETPGEDSTHPRHIGQNCTQCHIEYRMDVVCSTCHAQQGRAYRFSGKVIPPVPDVVVFEPEAGKVEFNHKIHMGDDVGEPCATCHHFCKGGLEMKGMPCRLGCRSCHYDLADKIPECKDDNHSRYIGANCTSCHDPDDCSTCHQD
jgi:hypothetical protein